MARVIAFMALALLSCNFAFAGELELLSQKPNIFLVDTNVVGRIQSFGFASA